jgi:DNA-binding HxlR family transcriptional regulator
MSLHRRPPRSGCPIATTLDLVGDRWTLVILRDMQTGKSKFSEFLASPEGIATNVLTSRLEKMVKTGLVTRKAYQKRPIRYEFRMTKKGKALLPVLHEMCLWGNRFLPNTWIPPESFMQAKVD